MKTPNIAAKDMGNGNNKEIAMLMPKEIPIHSIWFMRNCLLLLTFTHKVLRITGLLK